MRKVTVDPVFKNTFQNLGLGTQMRVKMKTNSISIQKPFMGSFEVYLQLFNFTIIRSITTFITG